MVNVYIWRPEGLIGAIKNGIAPDLGHVSLEVVDAATGTPTTYASYWPETDSLIGVATQSFKPRHTRNPASYAEDSDPENGFMQRVADFKVSLDGLDEAKIAREWGLLYDTPYDFRTWNCSSVVKSLTLRAMSSEGYSRVAPVADCTDDTLADVTDGADLLSRLRQVFVNTVVDCRPDDVLRVAAAYNNEEVEDIKRNQEENADETPPITLSEGANSKPALAH